MWQSRLLAEQQQLDRPRGSVGTEGLKQGLLLLSRRSLPATGRTLLVCGSVKPSAPVGAWSTVRPASSSRFSGALPKGGHPFLPVAC